MILFSKLYLRTSQNNNNVTTMSTQSVQYQCLYEIQDVKNCVIDDTTGAIIEYELCEPLVNLYKLDVTTYLFKSTRTVMFVSEECPPNIIELLSLDELFRIFTEEEFYEMFNIPEDSV